jgi:hypothetical protein
MPADGYTWPQRRGGVTPQPRRAWRPVTAAARRRRCCRRRRGREGLAAARSRASGTRCLHRGRGRGTRGAAHAQQQAGQARAGGPASAPLAAAVACTPRCRKAPVKPRAAAPLPSQRAARSSPAVWEGLMPTPSVGAQAGGGGGNSVNGRAVCCWHASTPPAVQAARERRLAPRRAARARSPLVMMALVCAGTLNCRGD